IDVRLVSDPHDRNHHQGRPHRDNGQADDPFHKSERGPAVTHGCTPLHGAASRASSPAGPTPPSGSSRTSQEPPPGRGCVQSKCPYHHSPPTISLPLGVSASYQVL